MSLLDYLRSIAHSWALVLGLTVAGGVLGFAVSATTPDVYRSTSSVLLTSDRGNSTSELVQGSAYVQNLVATYVLLTTSEIVLQPVIDELDLDTSVQSLASTITASSPLNSVIIEIGVASRDPEVAQDIAAEVARSLTRVVTDEVSPTTEDGTPTVRLTTIQSATLPNFPFEPNTRLDILLGALLGLVVGVGLAVTRALVWNTTRSPKDIAEVTSAPVVGEVVEARRDMTLPASIISNPLSIEAESIRGFAANLNFLRLGRGLRSFVVTSASPSEGKSSIVTSLGLILAESGKRVLLVDADLRNPSLARLTQLEGSVGLTNVLIGEHDLDAATQQWGMEGLDVLTAGSVPPNPGQVLSSEAMHEFLRDASDAYDVVIVDSAPVLSVTDAMWLGNTTDGAIIVTRYERTTTRALRRVMESMDSVGVAVLGIAISRMPRRVRKRYGGADYGIENRPKKDDSEHRTESHPKKKKKKDDADHRTADETESRPKKTDDADHQSANRPKKTKDDADDRTVNRPKKDYADSE